MSRKLRFLFFLILMGLIHYKKCHAEVPNFHRFSYLTSHIRNPLRIKKFQKSFIRNHLRELIRSKSNIVLKIIDTLFNDVSMASKNSTPKPSIQSFRAPGWLYRYRKQSSFRSLVKRPRTSRYCCIWPFMFNLQKYK